MPCLLHIDGQNISDVGFSFVTMMAMNFSTIFVSPKGVHLISDSYPILSLATSHFSRRMTRIYILTELYETLN